MRDLFKDTSLIVDKDRKKDLKRKEPSQHPPPGGYQTHDKSSFLSVIDVDRIEELYYLEISLGYWLQPVKETSIHSLIKKTGW